MKLKVIIAAFSLALGTTAFAAEPAMAPAPASPAPAMHHHHHHHHHHHCHMHKPVSYTHLTLPTNREV